MALLRLPIRSVIAMIHLRALPGTSGNDCSVSAIVEAAKREAEIYRESGVDGILVENMHDRPYVRHAGPEIVSAMTSACLAVKGAFAGPCGVQILAGANEAALAVAMAAGSGFHPC